jgi:hypothetical protein
MNELTPFLPNATSTRMPELLKKLESLHVSSQALREAQLLILEASLRAFKILCQPRSLNI